MSHREGWKIERFQMLFLWKLHGEIPSDRSQLSAEWIEPFISQICIHYRKSQRRELLYTSYIFSSPGLVAIGLNVWGREEKKSTSPFCVYWWLFEVFNICWTSLQALWIYCGEFCSTKIMLSITVPNLTTILFILQIFY